MTDYSHCNNSIMVNMWRTKHASVCQDDSGRTHT